MMAACALVFLASAWVTVTWCGSLCQMHGTWQRMPGQGWPEHFLGFLGMWAVMMVAMMMPVFTPALLRFRRSLATVSGDEAQRLSGRMAAGYFTAWSLLGVGVYPLGVLAAQASERLSTSIAGCVAGGALVCAGWLQLTRAKQRHLDCCQAMVPSRRWTSAAAWREGWRAGLRCIRCCLGPTVALLVLGAMDLWVMTLVTAAITAERLAPARLHVARFVGALLIALGACLGYTAYDP
jgi:predicted metal-binding membrane protein